MGAFMVSSLNFSLNSVSLSRLFFSVRFFTLFVIFVDDRIYWEGGFPSVCNVDVEHRHNVITKLTIYKSSFLDLHL